MASFIGKTSTLSPLKAIEAIEKNDATMPEINLNGSTSFQMNPLKYASAIVAAMGRNTSVKVLDLGGCGIATSTALEIAAMLKTNKTLQRLSLENNKINSDGVEAILAALEFNSSLVEINLLNAGPTRAGESALSALCLALEKNTTLENIIWRLDSRQAWKITKLLSRNKELHRRSAQGKSFAAEAPVSSASPAITTRPASATFSAPASSSPARSWAAAKAARAAAESPSSSTSTSASSPLSSSPSPSVSVSSSPSSPSPATSTSIPASSPSPTKGTVTSSSASPSESISSSPSTSPSPSTSTASASSTSTTPSTSSSSSSSVSSIPSASPAVEPVSLSPSPSPSPSPSLTTSSPSPSLTSSSPSSPSGGWTRSTPLTTSADSAATSPKPVSYRHSVAVTGASFASPSSATSSSSSSSPPASSSPISSSLSPSSSSPGGRPNYRRSMLISASGVSDAPIPGFQVNGADVSLATARKIPSHALALLQGNCPAYTSVHLEDNSLFQLKADELGVAFAQALARNTHVTSVTITKCNLASPSARAFADMLQVNKKVRVLDLSNNRMDSESVGALCGALRNNETLEELNLMGQTARIGEDALSALCTALEHNITLKKIIWRLDSRQAWKITKYLSRNNEIERRKEQGKNFQDILPDSRK